MTIAQSAAYEEYVTQINFQIEASINRVALARQIPRYEGDTPVKNSIDRLFHDALDAGLDQGNEQGAVHYDPSTLGKPPKNIKAVSTADYALPMFTYAKQLEVNPIELANKVVSAASQDEASPFEMLEALGPYVNGRVKDELLIANVEHINNLKGLYGQKNTHQGEVVVIDYSGPNVAKPFGINHLRSTVIGEALAHILDADGYTVVRDNHLGDWGTQFGNLLAAYDTYASEHPFDSLSTDELNELYVRFNEEKKARPELARKGQQFFARLEAGDAELLQRWAIAQKSSKEEFSTMYNRLNVNFDTQVGEGYFVTSAPTIVEELVSSGVESVVKDPHTGSVYIDSEHPIVLRTQDGYCVYAARDLATIGFRVSSYQPDAILYVVGEEQASSFRGVFELANRVGLSRTNDTQAKLEYVGFGLLLDDSGKKLSTRKGTSGKLSDILDAVDARAYTETKVRNPDLDEVSLHEISRNISVGAVIWNDLRADRKTSVRFDINAMLALGGGSIIDVYYSYARSRAIIDKAGDISVDSAAIPQQYSNATEHQLAFAMSEFPDVIKKAAVERAPHLITTYLQDLAQLHGKFYESSRILGIDDPGLAMLRLNLHRAYRVVVANGLNLLNIPIVDHI